ncbi:hypothetical protein FH972_008566 [Carpinus fangiana]|uniref:Uncharacterized protein n=1 Tax=Carpinus fangiana TaxID=176857 RepID=A0A5N6QZ73_9ROSI|nr:hypothetical protein FH972_008566 [Carpinus fangiana]
MGRLTAGVQYEPQYENKDGAKYKNLMNWSCAIGYGVGSGSPLSPSFNFGLELAKSSQFALFIVAWMIEMKEKLSLTVAWPGSKGKMVTL